MKDFLFIAGINGSAGLFAPIATELEARGWTVHRFEHCDESRPADWESIERLAEGALAVLDSARVEQAVVCGESFGGAVAQLLAYRSPRRVSRLILIGTFAYLPFHKRRERLHIIYPVLAAIARLIPRVAVRFSKRIYNPSVGRHEPPALREAVLKEHLASLPCYVYKAKLAMLFDSRSWIHELQIPTLVVAGDTDRLIPSACSREVAAAIPGAELLLIPGGGHLSHYGFKELFLTRLLSFLGEASLRQSKS